MPKRVDSWLLRRFAQTRENRFFDELASRFRPQIVGWALSMLHDPEEAEDAAQEVLLIVFHKADTFKQESRLATWLYAITRNACISKFRRRWRANCFHLADMDLADRRPRSIDAQLDVAEFLPQLDKDHRQALQLIWLENWMYSEAAIELGVPEGTVKSRVHRALHQLRKKMAA